LSIDFYVPKEDMKRPELHYLTLAERFRDENRASRQLPDDRAESVQAVGA